LPSVQKKGFRFSSRFFSGVSETIAEIDTELNYVYLALAAVGVIAIFVNVMLVPPMRNAINAHSAFTTASLVPVAAIGWTAISGVPMTAICNVPIFLALGTGVANCFIIHDAFHSQDSTVGLPERAGHALSSSGPFGLMTTITALIAFGSGINTPYPAMLWFAQYAMVTMTFSYIHSILSHTAHLVFNVQLRLKLKYDDPKFSGKLEQEGCMRFLKFEGRTVLDALFSRLGSGVILVVLAISVSVAAWGMTHLEQGIDDVTNVPDNSDFARFFKSTSDRLPVNGPDVNTLLVVNEHELLGNYRFRLVELENSLSNTSQFGGYVVNPWRDFVQACDFFGNALAQESGNCFSNITTMRASLYNFMYSLPFSAAYATHAKLIDHDVDHQGKQVVTIRAVRLQYVLKSMTRQGQRYKDLVERNDITVSTNEFTINPFDVISQSLPSVVPDTILNCGVGAAAVMVSLFFFLPPGVAVIVVVCVLIIDILLLGWMKALSLPLNLATSVCMTMAIGFAIDYSSDIAFSFHEAAGSSTERARHACLTMAKPIFTGGFSSILASFPLLFTLTPAGKLFAIMVIGTVIIGVFVGCLALPVALATFAGSQPVRKPMSI